MKKWGCAARWWKTSLRTWSYLIAEPRRVADPDVWGRSWEKRQSMKKNAKEMRLKVTVVNDQAAWLSCVKEERKQLASLWLCSWLDPFPDENLRRKCFMFQNVAFWDKRGVSCLTFGLTEANVSAEKKKQPTIQNIFNSVVKQQYKHMFIIPSLFFENNYVYPWLAVLQQQLFGRIYWK